MLRHRHTRVTIKPGHPLDGKIVLRAPRADGEGA